MIYCAYVEAPRFCEHILVGANTEQSAWDKVQSAGYRVLSIELVEYTFYDHYGGLAFLRPL